jgi:hypothetical protein
VGSMHVKLMPEYECDFPLWIDHEEAAPTAVNDPELRARIVCWNHLFLCHFDAEAGWLDIAAEERFADEGVALAAVLKEHFGPGVDFFYDPWPVGHRS